MKKSALLALAGTTMALATAAQAQVYSSAVAVPLNDLVQSTGTIAVAGGPASITDLNVILRVAHTWDADVDVALVGPGDAKSIILTTDNGGTADNYSTTRFDDLAVASITTGAAPFNGNFKPHGLAGAYDGALPGGAVAQDTFAGFNGDDSNGTWTIYGIDDEAGIVGNITYWSLEFNGSVDPEGPTPLGAPTNPIITASAATPNNGLAGSVTLLTANVLPGTFPTSTGLVVSADLTAIGGLASQAFVDDGSNGDLTAGDGIYSFSATIGAVAGGAKVLPVSVSDAQARTATANINYFVSAAPGVFTDLGTVTCTGINQTFDIAAGEVKWFKMTIPAIIDAPNYFADFWTNSTGTLADTEIGLYDASGAIVDFDDDSGNANKSMLTFGDTVNFRTNVDGFDFDLDGFNGTLAGGTYWLAVGAFNTTYLTGWQATSTSANTGSVDLRANISDPSCLTAPTNPTGVGSGGIAGECGGNVLTTVTVTPGINPASTGITVSLNTAALGGGSVAMVDNGTNGDVTSGDNIFSATVAVGGGADAVFALPFTVNDAEARSSGGSLNVTRSASEIGDLPATAKKYYGVSGSTITGTIGNNADSDMFAICISDTANFEASTNNGGAAFDTQLFLFNADGTGAAMNDDEPDVAQALQSHMMLNNSLLPAAPAVVLPSGGLYYLGIAGYDRDPITSAVITDTIWADQATTPASFDATWTPNGVTPAAAVVGWSGNANNAGGAFTITMVGGTTVCPADLSGGTAGVPDCAVDINDLLFFLGAFEAGNADIDNGSGNGVTDCATDINDLLFFLVRFEAGC